MLYSFTINIYYMYMLVNKWLPRGCLVHILGIKYYKILVQRNDTNFNPNDIIILFSLYRNPSKAIFPAVPPLLKIVFWRQIFFCFTLHIFHKNQRCSISNQKKLSIFGNREMDYLKCATSFLLFPILVMSSNYFFTWNHFVL